MATLRLTKYPDYQKVLIFQVSSSTKGLATLGPQIIVNLVSIFNVYTADVSSVNFAEHDILSQLQIKIMKGEIQVFSYT